MILPLASQMLSAWEWHMYTVWRGSGFMWIFLLETFISLRAASSKALLIQPPLTVLFINPTFMTLPLYRILYIRLVLIFVDRIDKRQMCERVRFGWLIRV